MNDPFTIHWFPLISHDVEQLDLPCHQFVFWTISGWDNDVAPDYAGVQLVKRHLCLENDLHIDIAFCVDKAPLFLQFDESTQSIDWLVRHCNTLRNNILKQLLCSQPDITWNRFPSTPGEVQNLSCQKIERCTKQMKRMHVRNANDHGKLDAQTSQAGFVQQQCYCKHSTHEEIRSRVSKGELLSPESPSSSNIVRVDVWVVNQWWIRSKFWVRQKFCIPKICSPRSIQATHTHACHSEVSIRLFGLWSPRPFVVASCKSRPHISLQQRPRSTEELSEIEILASVGWKCCRQPFSCPCSQNVTHCRKEICSAWWTCLSKESIFCIIPKFVVAEENLSHAEKQLGLVTELWFPRLVRTIQWYTVDCVQGLGLQGIDCALSCLTRDCVHIRDSWKSNVQ